MDPATLLLHSFCSNPERQVCAEGGWSPCGQYFVIGDSKDPDRPRLVLVREVWLALAALIRPRLLNLEHISILRIEVPGADGFVELRHGGQHGFQIIGSNGGDEVTHDFTAAELADFGTGVRNGLYDPPSTTTGLPAVVTVASVPSARVAKRVPA